LVNISQETTAETEVRLRRVIQNSRLKIFEDAYAFEEFPLALFAAKANGNALALVRDDLVWSQLLPSNSAKAERFGVFCFHFPPGADNSGFVGWLASHLKKKFGTGVFVTCGQNSKEGGIFDYWGCPIALSETIFEEVRALVAGEGAS
jgi:Family of unknown function (DUF6196)